MLPTEYLTPFSRSPFSCPHIISTQAAASSTNAKCETTHDTQNHRVSVAIFPLILTQIDCLTHLSCSQRDVFSGKFNINLQELPTLLESILKFIPIPPFDSKIYHITAVSASSGKIVLYLYCPLIYRG